MLSPRVTKPYVVLLIGLVCTILGWGSFASATEGGDAGAVAIDAGTGVPKIVSTTDLQFHLDEAKKDLTSHQEQASAIDREISSIAPIGMPTSFDGADFAKKLSALKKAVEGAGKHDCGSEISAVRHAWRRELVSADYIPWTESGRNGPAPGAVFEVRNQLRAQWAIEQKDTKMASLEDFLSSFMDSCESAKAELSELEESLKFDETGKSYRGAYEEARHRADRRLTAYRAALSTKQRELIDTIKEDKRSIASYAAQIDQAAAAAQKTSLQTQDIKASEGAISKTLLAIPLFVVALFVASFFFDRTTQATLIARRTVVELVGVALILMTIIVLGAAGKLKDEALGAIIGAIAGYVLGQQSLRLTSEASAPSGLRNPAFRQEGDREGRNDNKAPVAQADVADVRVPVPAGDPQSPEPSVKVRRQAILIATTLVIGTGFALAAESNRGSNGQMMRLLVLASMGAILSLGVAVAVFRREFESHNIRWALVALWGLGAVVLGIAAWFKGNLMVPLKWVYASTGCLVFAFGLHAAFDLWQSVRREIVAVRAPEREGRAK